MMRDNVIALGIALIAFAGVTETTAAQPQPETVAQIERQGPTGAADSAQRPAPESSRSIPGSRPPALTQGRATGDAKVRSEPGWFDRLWSWVLVQQQKANRQIVSAVKDLKSEGSPAAALALIVLSFIYGVLHAAGPGHGKAVISSYVLANERTVRRGIALSFLAAFFQAISAIAIIMVLVIAMQATSFQIKGVENWITTLSWGLIAALGAWLLFTQVRILWRAWQQKYMLHNASCDHVHRHGTHDATGTCCDHAHIPDARRLEGDWSWRKGMMIAASVGVRPCTGAILVLIFAVTNGLLWAGIAATFAMALGTAITVSVLAATAVGSRDLATRLAGSDGTWGWRIERTAGLVGSALVFVLGASFFAASLGPTPPF